MPTTALAPETRTCPVWCDQPDCQGEHGMTVGDGPVPATGGLPNFSPAGGVYFPAVTVALSWDTIDNLQPSVSLWINSERVDTQVDLLLHEAQALLTELGRAVAMLEAQG